MSDKPKPTDSALYSRVVSDAKKKFKRFPSLYASSWITREYVKRGGKYDKPKPKGGGKQAQWFKEEWIQIVPFLTTGKKIACGDPNKETKACRPTKRVDSSTPPLMREIVKKYGKEKVLSLARKKNRDMKGRLSWVRGTFTPSK
tara:strand:- start:2600 stop:3031 length:432 start_codon:yes stop_codon:yes gene_type:complete